MRYRRFGVEKHLWVDVRACLGNTSSSGVCVVFHVIEQYGRLAQDIGALVDLYDPRRLTVYLFQDDVPRRYALRRVQRVATG